jgi:hypothetical protein
MTKRISFKEYANNYFGYTVDISTISEEELSFIWELYEMEVIEEQ